MTVGNSTPVSSLLCARAILVVVVALMVNGCSSDMDDLRTYIDEVNARTSTDIEPIPEPKEYVAYTYVPAERRDPFTSPKRTAKPRSTAGSGPQPNLNRPTEPLEEFPIDGLKMVGTIGLGSRLKALIRSSDGAVHTVVPGNHLGRNFGRILKITAKEITIRELIQDGFGGYEERKVTLSADNE